MPKVAHLTHVMTLILPTCYDWDFKVSLKCTFKAWCPQQHCSEREPVGSNWIIMAVMSLTEKFIHWFITQWIWNEPLLWKWTLCDFHEASSLTPMGVPVYTVQPCQSPKARGSRDCVLKSRKLQTYNLFLWADCPRYFATSIESGLPQSPSQELHVHDWHFSQTDKFFPLQEHPVLLNTFKSPPLKQLNIGNGTLSSEITLQPELSFPPLLHHWAVQSILFSPPFLFSLTTQESCLQWLRWTLEPKPDDFL